MPWDSLVSRPISATRHHSMGWRWLLRMASAFGLFRGTLVSSCCHLVSQDFVLSCLRLYVCLLIVLNSLYFYSHLYIYINICHLMKRSYFYQENYTLHCPVPSMNIFVYLFNEYVASNLDICLVNYVASEYICIFVRVHFMISAHFCTTQDLFAKAGGLLEKQAQKQPPVARWRCQST